MKKTKMILSGALLASSLALFAACTSGGHDASKHGAGAHDDAAHNAAPEDAYAAKPNETVNITVSTNFEPKAIAVKKGQPVRLAFTRRDEENCGDEVVFPKLDIRRPLPVGETVTVELTPEQTGEIAFTCGMDMMRGKIVVQ